MDPLVATGLAGNVVQFVDFSYKVVSTARKLYKSAGGTIAENQELEALARDLCELAKKDNVKTLSKYIRDVIPPKTKRQPDDEDFREDEIIRQLSQQCIDISEDLIRVLQLLKVKRDNRAWESVYQALKSVWKQDDIDTLLLRLDRIRDQLNTRLNRKHQAQMERRFDNLAATNAGLEANRAREIKELKSEIALAFEELKKGVEYEGQAARAWSRLAITAHEGQVLSAEQHILNSLRFNTMDYRHAAITKEHQNTLHWVFDKSSVNVVEWLEGNNNLYWISGKPGSGKSTLMKFLWNHEQAEAHLKVWAGADTLIVASFYFWSPAKDSLQKSQTGLLRSILYQILRRCSELIRVAFPDPLQSTLSGFPCAPSEFLSSWQLLAAFERLSSVLELSKVKFCFFIDGLDEYEGAPVTIIQLVEILKRSPNVKICVSSRP